MHVTCFIQYTIEPAQYSQFAEYARNWYRIIPRCGGELLGYYLPHEGRNDQAFGLIRFESLAAYEAYRTRLKSDPQAMANFAFATEHRFIRSEIRTFLTDALPEAAVSAIGGQP